MYLSLYALLLRTLVIDLHAKNQHNICKGIENKRAMMALNRSPESDSPQNEFYLLYYYCSNL